LWCPEYAREYLQARGNAYQYENILEIARGQIRLEEEYIGRSRGKEYLFIDTDMYVMKVWSEFVFGKCHRFILDQVLMRRYDHYLLCNTELPWRPDELREYPELETRMILYNIYKDIMVNQETPWTEITGMEEQRVQMAIGTIDKLSV
jgi:nicotinamide riboside kinase